MPSTSQENSKATDMLPTENLDGNDDSFTANQLFSFAWQIAKGMVCFKFIIMVIDLIVWLKIKIKCHKVLGYVIKARNEVTRAEQKPARGIIFLYFLSVFTTLKRALYTCVLIFKFSYSLG